jgi:NADH:ubiquinone oxidoreductase subunit C
LGQGIVQEDVVDENGYYILIDPNHLYSVLFFLKNDPDLNLTLFDQIIAVPSQALPWLNHHPETKSIKILYQLKSIKLPYRVTVIIEISMMEQIIPTITPLFSGARWQEEDIAQTHHILIEKSMRDT